MKKVFCVTILFILASITVPAYAQVDPGLTGSGVLDSVMYRFRDAADDWTPVIIQTARYIFWSLALMSLVWTFGLLALRNADIQEFFAEFVKFIIPLGFFLWLLENAVSGANIAGTIVSSLQQLGAQAAGLTDPIYNTTRLGPSDVVTVGFSIFDETMKAASNLSWNDLGMYVAMVIAGCMITILLAIVAINMLLLLITGWILLYAGVFFLGFGGGRWTSDMAINYYRTVLNIAVQIFSMILLVGVGKSLLVEFANEMSSNVRLEELLAMIIVALTLLVLVNKIPPLLGGLVIGGGGGSLLGGGFGAGAAMGALATGGAALASGGAATFSAAKAGVFEGAGAGSAGIAALRAATGNSAAGDIDTSPMIGGEPTNADLPSGFETVAGATQVSDSSGGGVGAGRAFAGGVAAVAGGAWGDLNGRFSERVGNTVGGRVATAINEKYGSSQLGSGLGVPPMENGHETELDAEAETAAFVYQGKFPEE